MTGTSPACRRAAWLNGRIGDRAFQALALGFALLVVGLLTLLMLAVAQASHLSIAKFGWGFLTGTDWDPVAEHFGAAPFVYGTIVTSALAVLLATPVALGVGLFLSEVAPGWLRVPVTFLVDLLAAIPSVVYGLWGIFVLAPWLRRAIQPWLGAHLGFLPLFKGPAYGVGLMAGGVILAIMIVPTITAVAREVIRAVPDHQREAALALGATRWEMMRLGVLPAARSGIFGGIILGMGRALGETMAVTMVIGNRPEIAASLFAPGYTMASVIANEYTEATSALYLSALTEIALVLFLVSILMNAGARLLIWSVVRRSGGV